MIAIMRVLTGTALLLTPCGAMAQQLVTPVRSVVVNGSAEELGRIGWIAVLPGKSLVVAQPQDGVIKCYSPAGGSLGAGGGRGEGPGHFRAMGIHGVAGDSLWVYDAALKRITYADSRCRLGPSEPWSDVTTLRQGGGRRALPLTQIVPVVRLGNQQWIVTGFPIAGADRGGWAPAGEEGRPYLRRSSTGEVENLAAWISTRSCTARFQIGGRPASVVQPLCAEPMVEFAQAGGFIATVQQDAVSGRATVTVIAAGGDTLRRYRPTSVPSPVPARVADSTAKAMVERVPPGEARAALQANLRVASHYPLITRALAGDDGSVWVERWTSTGPREWVVFGGKGADGTVVRIPRNAKLLVVRLDRAWGVESDDDGVESVAVYAIPSRPPR